MNNSPVLVILTTQNPIKLKFIKYFLQCSLTSYLIKTNKCRKLSGSSGPIIINYCEK